MTADPTPIESARADADTARDKAVEVPLGDAVVHVLPFGKWKGSAIRALREGDFDSWAEKCLDGDDYDTWAEVDPDVEAIDEFFTAWEQATGQNVGKSKASSRSSRRTARR